MFSCAKWLPQFFNVVCVDLCIIAVHADADGEVLKIIDAGPLGQAVILDLFEKFHGFLGSENVAVSQAFFHCRKPSVSQTLVVVLARSDNAVGAARVLSNDHLAVKPFDDYISAGSVSDEKVICDAHAGMNVVGIKKCERLVN